MKLRSYRNRPPPHLGPYPLETLARAETASGLDRLAPPMPGLSFRRPPDDPLSIVNAMQEYQAMLDATREGGLVKRERGGVIPSDPVERANHLKSFGYYCDAAMVGICEIPASAWLDSTLKNPPDVDRLAKKIETMQVKTYAAGGVDVIMAGLRESLKAPPPADCRHHSHAIVFLYDMPRDPEAGEDGTDWIEDAQAHRACLRGGMETSVTLANYIRSLGWEARAHSEAASDIHLGQLAVAAGLATVQGDTAVNPFHGRRFGLSVVTTTLDLAPPDKPLAENAKPPATWRNGLGTHARNSRNVDPPYQSRRFMDGGAHPFEKLKRVDDPTTYIDRANVARVPKRANMFARSLFGDLGPIAQEGSKNGNYVRKSAAAFAFRPSLGAFILLQDGVPPRSVHPSTTDPTRNAANIKGALYFLGCDAVGLSECPDWAYYSMMPSGGKPLIRITKTPFPSS